MKKTIVRIICLIAAFTLAVSFAACKSKSKDTDDKKADDASAAKTTVSGDGENTETPDDTGDSASGASAAQSTAESGKSQNGASTSSSNGGTSAVKTGSNTQTGNNNKSGNNTQTGNNTGTNNVDTGDTVVDETLNGEWI